MISKNQSTEKCTGYITTRLIIREFLLGTMLHYSCLLLAALTRRHHKPIGLLRNAQLLPTDTVRSENFDINKTDHGTNGERIQLKLLLSDRATFIMREAKTKSAITRRWSLICNRRCN